MFISKLGPMADFTGRGGMTRITTYGVFKGKSIAIDNFRDKNGKIVEKRFVIWDEVSQIIRNKIRNKNGKGFRELWA